MHFTTLFVGLAAVISLVSASPVQNKRALAPVYRSCQNPKQVAMTFDDGAPYIWDADLQATFAKYKAKATFFVNGNNWRCIYDPERVEGMRALFKDGHEFASHTWSHANLTTLAWDKIHSEMWKVEEALIRILGVNPAIVRPPYGEYNDLVRSAANARNQTIALWDFDSEDTLGRTAASTQALYKTLVDKKVSSIAALNHSISNSTVHEVIPYALDLLSKAGYKFVTASECFGVKAYQTTVPEVNKDTAAWKC
ncbi:carbohydrate esterase family 4 protein [Auriculariales sp. MPI-PUGE-AT-0066]|nr:carbohydrate esterase family 4 protein [Auriculariales sp. MPI-PUGE-AT-0066]